jgi:uncharacterized membrane protein (DUF485 family)
MADQEKQAWFMLGVILVTLAAYFTFISLVRFDSVSLAVFALSGFLGVRVTKRRRGEIVYDERDRQIERRALLLALTAFYTLVLVFMLVAGFAHGWDRSVPLWLVIQIFWVASLLIWGIKAIAIIVLHRRGVYA